MTDISVIITSFKDNRVFRLVEELLKQDPFEVIIADGGSDEKMLTELGKLENDRVRLYILPGNIAETRYQVRDMIRGDIAVFIDTDELPTEGWLSKLTDPIAEGKSDFTFGSTVPLNPPENRYSRYLNDYDEYLYDQVLTRDIMKGALGNSAWRSALIKKIGFDPCLGIGGEDYDLTIRAVKSGFKGKYVKEAVLLHDQNGVRTMKKFLKKIFYNYMVGASLAYRKNGLLFRRVGASASANVKFRDPFEVLMFLLKPTALIFSLMIDPWNDPRLCNGKFKA